eukprot:2564104-Alexandrium_andersonii.AAC.1
MSASLVGSEMCIRDSPRTPLPSMPCPRSPPCRPTANDLPLLSQRLPKGCLLYTSDAADDM